MPLILGTQPDWVEVWLTPGADFYETVEAMNPTQQFPEPWPVGTEISLEFSGGIAGTAVWTATVATNLASWAEQSDAVQDVIDAGLGQVTLWYVNGIVKVPLAVGTVKVYG